LLPSQITSISLQRLPLVLVLVLVLVPCSAI
jgi:hypothetical protein